MLTTTASGFGRLEQTRGVAAVHVSDGDRQLGRTLQLRSVRCKSLQHISRAVRGHEKVPVCGQV
jgi:hypothetical protein